MQLQRKKQKAQLNCQEEFSDDFWSFCKKLFDSPTGNVQSDCSPDAVFDFFCYLYSSEGLQSSFNYPEWLNPQTPPLQPMDDGSITMSEIIWNIKKSHAKSSPSPVNGIGYVVFKRCPSLWPALLNLFNECWSSQRVPTICKQVTIKLIPKPPAFSKASDINNFRPIALT